MLEVPTSLAVGVPAVRGASSATGNDERLELLDLLFKPGDLRVVRS